MTADGQRTAAVPGWYPDPKDPFMQRWWDGSAWTDDLVPTTPLMTAAAPPRLDIAVSTSTPSAEHAKGSGLEQRIATFIGSLGYDVQTNVILEGRSGSRHEIDVFGVKSDALSSFRVAVECKAWEQPIEKDVVAKFHYVLNDLGFREGIIVALGGSRTGAATAAEELGIALWGPDELRERLGAVAVADLHTSAPRHEATGLPVQTDETSVHAFFKREARGRLGFGAETIVWSSLVWLPSSIVQLALSRTEGRFKKMTQTRRIWNAYDRVDGNFIDCWESPPPLETVDLANRSLRPKQREASAARTINDAIKKYKAVSTDAARARHSRSLIGLGIPTDYTVVAESTTAAFAPLYVAIAQRRMAERLIVVDAHRGRLHAGLGASLSHNIHWLRDSLS